MSNTIHEKIIESINSMLIDTMVGLPYYGNFNLFINFIENENVQTCGVNMTGKGMNFYYNPKFLERLSQREVNFITLHEDFHLLWDHPKRTITGAYDHKLSNIAQDMIINYIILEDISKNFIEIPKDEQGKNMTLIIPKEYDGKLIFEEVYEWLKKKKNEYDKNCKNCSTCNGSGKKQNDQGQQDGKGKDQKENGKDQECPDCNGTGKGKSESKNPEYGPYGKDPNDKDGGIDSHSLDSIFDNLEKNGGQYLDQHIGDEISEELREGMIKEAMERLASRGLCHGDIQKTLDRLQKKRKDYLKEIKRNVSNLIFGTVKQKTIVKPNRRQINGLKGNRKVHTRINVIIDTSGSMWGLTERVLSYIYRNNVEVNLIQADTQVNQVDKLKNTKKLDKLKISGGGGTILQPSIDYIVENGMENLGTVLLSDGYCDSLNFSEIKGKVLIITAGVKVPISKSNGKIKQIIVEDTK